jgi:cytochrome P450
MAAEQDMNLDVNHRDPEFLANPFPIFKRLRDEEPIHWSPNLRGWVLTRYEDVREVLVGDDMTSDRMSPFFNRVSGEERNKIRDLIHYLGKWAVFRDPPEHTHLRNLMNQPFTPRIVEKMRVSIEGLVAGMIDGVAETGKMDVISDLAYPLPATVMMDLLGVPRSELDLIKHWSDDIALFIGSAQSAEDKYAKAQAATHDMAEYFRSMIEERKKSPKDDLTTGMLEARERGEMLSEDELIGNCILLLFAGHETTTNLMGNGMLALMRNRDQLDLLNDQPQLVSSAVEELLRYDGPSGSQVRIVARELEMNGKILNEGDRIFAFVNAGNRDERRFTNPDTLNIARKRNRHLTFGQGIHFCLGAPLARLESQIAIREMSKRLKDVHLAIPETDLQFIDSVVLRGVKSLPVEFEAA